eukprot:9315201-Pyramimonas_sp.AAC.1
MLAKWFSCGGGGGGEADRAPARESGVANLSGADSMCGGVSASAGTGADSPDLRSGVPGGSSAGPGGP